MRPGDRVQSLIDDPLGLADLQHEFLQNLENNQFDINEKVLQNPANNKRISVKEAAESGVLDVVTGEIVHPSSGRRYSIPRAVHMHLVDSGAAKRLMEGLNLSLEELNQSSAISPDSQTMSGLSPGGGSAHSSRTKTVNWHGQPSELRSRQGDPLLAYTTITSQSTTADIPAWESHRH